MSIERLFWNVNPEYRHRYEVYNELISDLLDHDKVWIDVGCGCNENVANYGRRARIAIGIDAMVHPELAAAPFAQANLRAIPLRSGCADLVTMRMVVEHLEKVPEDFSEVQRILKPGGRLVILTTNKLSPLVFGPAFLPYRAKKELIRRMFHAADEDVFPTFHRCNTPRAMRSGIGSMRLHSLQYLEEVPLDSPGMAVVFGGWYLLTRVPFLTQLRSTMLAVFEKRN